MSKNTIHVTARAAIVEDDHMLLCKTRGLNPNFYFLPGGHVEQGESAVSALARELREETGFECKVERFLGLMEYSFDPNEMQHAKCHTHEYDLVFTASCPELVGPDSKLTQLEEHIELHWVSLKQLDKIDLRPEPLVHLLPKWLELELAAAFASQMAG
jgi:8-oxo-dGTP diphosphatase